MPEHGTRGRRPLPAPPARPLLLVAALLALLAVLAGAPGTVSVSAHRARSGSPTPPVPVLATAELSAWPAAGRSVVSRHPGHPARRHSLPPTTARGSSWQQREPWRVPVPVADQRGGQHQILVAGWAALPPRGAPHAAQRELPSPGCRAPPAGAT